MKEVICLVLFILFTAAITSSAHDGEFVAAVYEHAVIVATNRKTVLSKQEALRIVMKNMDIYETQIQRAKRNNTRIIVFPEYGLTGFELTRDSFKPFLEDIPDPTKVQFTACSDPKVNLSLPIIYRLSCLARDHSIYIVANMGDIKPCTSKDPHCPKDRRYQYNTNVVFDDKGKLVARYHKQHPFRSEMKFVNRPQTPEIITFNTPFGKFGTMICFDALFHDPAITLVTQENVDHMAFPTAWFDVRLFTAIGFHSSWARGMQVNFLAANTHFPNLKNTGSGIYSPSGVKSYFRSMTSKNGSLRIGVLLKKPSKTSRKFSSTNKIRIQMTSSGDTFYSRVSHDLFLFKELKNAEDSLSLCYNKSDICCSLDYKMSTKRADELFALGVFDGLHSSDGRYYRFCALIKCEGLSHSTCGQSTSNSKTIFDSFTLKGQLHNKFVLPQVVGDGVTLLPGEWDHDVPVTYLKTKKKLSKGLIEASLFARVYDDEQHNHGTHSKCISSSFVWVTLLLTLFLK